MKKLILLFLGLILISCGGGDDEDVTPVQVTPEPVVVQKFTLTVSAAEGGSVNTSGGTFDSGASVNLTATAENGYEFIGWTGSEVTSNEVSITVNTNLTLIANFQLIEVATNYYSSGDIIAIESVVFYDRELTINGIKLIAAGNIGGQEAVPDKWIYKTAQVFKLLIDKDSEGIDSDAQLNMIKTLKGDIGWHQGRPTGQKIARGGGNEYTPSFLDDNKNQSYQGIEAFEDALAVDDMVWYKNIDSQGTGDDDINEIIEHTLHTLHRFGVRGGVEGSTEALNIEAEEEDITNTDIFLAMKEAYTNGVFDIEGYGEGDMPGDINNRDAWPVMLKEYQYLLTYGMWEFSEFWEGGSLSPEWNDNARTPEGVLANNPLGYEIYNTYFKPVISIPSKELLRTIFQDNDQGESGYVPDNAAATTTYSISVTASSNSDYTLSGTDANGSVSGDDVSITISAGDTLNFNVDAANHPFYIKTAQGTGTDNQVSNVTNNGATNGTVTWTPTTAGTYYYQCSAHDGMYGTITVQ